MREQRTIYEALTEAIARPALFDAYTADELWTDPHMAERMLGFHLDGVSGLSSRPFPVIDASVRWLVERFALGAGSRVLDLGCGPGLYAARLAACGADVTGVDFSNRSLAWARAEADRTGVPVRYVLGSYLDALPEGSYDLVTLIMCDYCALSPVQRSALLARIRGVLAPGGRFVFDVYSMKAYDARDERVECARDLLGGFFSAEPYVGVLARFRYDTEAVSLDKYTIVQPTGSRVLLNWLAHFDGTVLAQELEAAGFRVQELVGDLAGGALSDAAPEFGVVACLD